MNTDFSSYDQYDITENDPYIISPDNYCLKNLLGITNTAELNQAEADIVSITMADLSLNPVPATFDLPHLQAIHQRLFSDVYPFAGEIRQAEIAKSNKLFMPYKVIQVEGTSTFQDLKDEGYLNGFNMKEFAHRAGYYFNRVNTMHAFREGNGRTQRALFDQLAKLAGYAFNWSEVSQQAMGLACQKGRIDEDNGVALGKLLANCIIRL